MPLSEHEQQLLDQIEQALYAEDPKFASNVRGARFRNTPRRRRIEGIAVFVVGIALLVTGMLIPFRVLGVPVVSVIGFLLMFFGALLTLTQIGRRAESASDEDDDGGKSGKSGKGGKGGSGKASPTRSPLAQRMEERLRKRFEQGG